ncbi:MULTISPECIES: energy transducer TonB [Providencia]|uniref:TonB family C-terminal domain n=2 Tax=Providencia rettgeri TaxID=587 RepID=A0A379FVM6_PRORE|nr:MULTISPECIES: energy transducer TonB [Providencia]EJD6376063.1 TonB family protein [Providencia rettgeri]EJF7710190.1 TonB family protein [Providencia rettgeri]ELR5115404.1 TonB family protein [Providencia rettgeri]MBI6202293.1 TonB family protein [Providencia rettgeri]MCG5281251.1 energy transducer TonB [Providencia rettgeri]
MTINPFFRYKLALALSLVIHIIAIMFIALQAGRAVPMVEGEETITLSLGGPMGSAGGSGEQSSKRQAQLQEVISESSSKAEAASQLKQLSKSQPNESKIPSKTQLKNSLTPVNVPVDNTIESPLLTQKTKVNIKPEISQPVQGKKQEKQSKLLNNDTRNNTENQLIANNISHETQQDSLETAKETPSNSAAKNHSSTTSSTSESSQGGKGNNILSGNNQFAANGDGSYTALSSSGISYTILQDATPKYPKEARSLGYTKVVKVQIRLLVGLDGQVESVEILNNKIPDLGFKEEAVKAIKKMTFKPIIYQGQNIKMYFKKTVIFQY